MSDNPVAAVRGAVEAAVEAARQRVQEQLGGRTPPVVPGTPGSVAPSYAEPTEPVGPAAPKPDQAGPDRRTPTGTPTGLPATAWDSRARS